MNFVCRLLFSVIFACFFYRLDLYVEKIKTERGKWLLVVVFFY